MQLLSLPLKSLSIRKRTRVLYLIDSLTVGGAQRALLSQATALDPERFELRVASLELLPGGSLADAFREAGITVHPLAAAGEPFGLAPLRLQSLIKSFLPDIVHTHLAASGITGRWAARAQHVPHVISTLHDVPEWTELASHPVRVMDRATLTLADRICAVSDVVRDAVVCLSPGLADRTITLRCGVPLEPFEAAAASRDAARARLGFAPADFVVATTARLETCKGIHMLLQAAGGAFEHARTLKLLIVGDGRERERLESFAIQRGISSWVTFTGLRSDVPQLLAAADLFAVPTTTGGPGVAAIEALATGLPVLASDVGGLPEIVEDGVCGRLLPPRSVRAWTRAIIDAARTPGQHQAWRRAAVQRSRAFSIESSVSALVRLYASMRAGDARHKMAA